MLFRSLRALQEGRRISEIEGLDGNRRMYGVGSPRFSRTPLLVAIGAPLDRTVARIDQGFWWRILLLAGIALVSVLTARFYIYGLIEAWTGQITAATTAWPPADCRPASGASRT